MAKDITIKNPQGTITFYPKTVSQLVFDNDNGKTVAEEIGVLDNTVNNVVENHNSTAGSIGDNNKGGIIQRGTAKWFQPNSLNYRHLQIDVKSEDKVIITTNRYVQYGFLTERVDSPQNNENAPLCDGTEIYSVTRTTTDELTVPSDCHCLYVMYMYNGGSAYTPISIKINGVERMGTINERLENAIENIQDIKDINDRLTEVIDDLNDEIDRASSSEGDISQSILNEKNRAEDSEASILSQTNSLHNDVEALRVALQETIDRYEPISMTVEDGAIINNAADEEDITSVNNLLKFKDRLPIIGNKGYKILRSGSFENQTTSANTIYEIRYNFSLTRNFTIPEGCVLYFNGGSINGNYILNGSDTRIIYLAPWLGSDIELNGTFSIDNDVLFDDEIYKSVVRNQKRISNMIVLSDKGKKCIFSKGNYYDIDSILISNDIDLDFCGGTIYTKTSGTHTITANSGGGYYTTEDGIMRTLIVPIVRSSNVFYMSAFDTQEITETTPFAETDIKRIRISNLIIDGNFEISKDGSIDIVGTDVNENEYTVHLRDVGSGNQGDMSKQRIRAIQIFNVDNVELDNIEIKNFAQGSYWSGATYYTSADTLIRRYHLYSISIVGYKNCKISSNIIHNCGGDTILTIPQDIESNIVEYTNNHSYNLYGTPFAVHCGRAYIYGNTFEDFNGSALNSFCYDSIIENNVFKNGQRSCCVDLSEGSMYRARNVVVRNNIAEEIPHAFVEGYGDNIYVIGNSVKCSDALARIRYKINPNTPNEQVIECSQIAHFVRFTGTRKSTYSVVNYQADADADYDGLFIKDNIIKGKGLFMALNRREVSLYNTNVFIEDNFCDVSFIDAGLPIDTSIVGVRAIGYDTPLRFHHVKDVHIKNNTILGSQCCSTSKSIFACIELVESKGVFEVESNDFKIGRVSDDILENVADTRCYVIQASFSITIRQTVTDEDDGTEEIVIVEYAPQFYDRFVFANNTIDRNFQQPILFADGINGAVYFDNNNQGNTSYSPILASPYIRVNRKFTPPSLNGVKWDVGDVYYGEIDDAMTMAICTSEGITAIDRDTTTAHSRGTAFKYSDGSIFYLNSNGTLQGNEPSIVGVKIGEMIEEDFITNGNSEIRKIKLVKIGNQKADFMYYPIPNNE